MLAVEAEGIVHCRMPSVAFLAYPSYHSMLALVHFLYLEKGSR